ncbi:lasso peptide biosynthesis B2 protein [Neobacillus mesonae]|uniref:lasso peptide biosynthesis B2 protein n=1 Tax=Neobacillus mesonae TaxID=1193713 RepID=UPI0037C76024
MKKVKLFITFGWKTKLMLLEAFLFLGLANIFKKMPFHKIVPKLGRSMDETSFSSGNTDIKILKSVSQAVHIMSRHTFWESKCLVKAIAAMKMLERRKIESTLYLGTGKDDSGKMTAHAWLRSGPYYITGADGMEKFTVVGKFAKRLSEYEGERHGS